MQTPTDQAPRCKSSSLWAGSSHRQGVNLRISRHLLKYLLHSFFRRNNSYASFPLVSRDSDRENEPDLVQQKSKYELSQPCQ